MNLKRLILFTLGILIFVYCLFKFDVLAPIAQLKNVSLVPLLLLVILIHYVLFIRAIKWQYLVSRLTDVKVPFLESLKVASSAFFIGFATPGRLGEISKVFLMKDLDKEKVFSLTAIEYLMDFISMFTLPIFFSIIYFYQIKYFIGVLVFVFIGIIGIYLLFNHFDKLIHIFIRNKKITSTKKEIIKDLKDYFKHKKTMINGLILSHLNYFIFYLIAFFTFKVVGFEGSFWIIIAGFSIGHLIGAISFIPIGLGTREVSATAFFVLQGFSIPDVMYPLVILRIISLAPLFIAFLIYMWFIKETT